jgi:hypothetical protein
MNYHEGECAEEWNASIEILQLAQRSSMYKHYSRQPAFNAVTYKRKLEREKSNNNAPFPPQ